MRVVIADDLNTPRMQLRRIIVNDLGLTVVGEARDGAQAVDHCRKHHPDVVILDISMPVMTGLQAARIISEERLATHIVIVSSQAQHAITDQLRAMGARFCLKPYDQEQLRALMRSIDGDA